MGIADDVVDRIAKKLSGEMPNGFVSSIIPEDRRLISALYDSGLLPQETLDSAIRSSVLNEARRHYEMMLNDKRYYADDSIRFPENLAYALEQRCFSEEEVREINFDRGEDLNSFIENNGFKGDYIEYLRLQLLGRKKESDE